MKKILVLALAFTAFSTAAFAQNPIDEFRQLDIDRDDNLSMSEAQSRFPNVTVKMYMEADGNSDGELSQDEFVFVSRAYAKAQAEGLIP